MSLNICSFELILLMLPYKPVSVCVAIYAISNFMNVSEVDLSSVMFYKHYH